MQIIAELGEKTEWREGAAENSVPAMPEPFIGYGTEGRIHVTKGHWCQFEIDRDLSKPIRRVP